MHFLCAFCLFASLTYFDKLLRLFLGLRLCRFFRHRPVWSGLPLIFSTPSGSWESYTFAPFKFSRLQGTSLSLYVGAAFRGRFFMSVCLSVSFRSCFNFYCKGTNYLGTT